MDEVEEIKQRLEVADVVGGYVQLKQAGRNLKAPCPFHQEKTASFTVSPEKGIWHCFGCGQGGDIFSFVQKIEGVDFRGALEILARRAGVELKSTGGRPKEKTDRLYEALALATKYYQASLPKNAAAVNYLVKQRRLNRETLQNFQLGYAPDSWEALTKFLTKRGFASDELLKAGLAGQRPGKSTIYDLFRGRVMFPITDGQGQVIGFTARVMDDSLPKYINTPQTPLYDKSRAIFGLSGAKDAIRKADEAVLVEGNMDVIASHQAGIKQVVAASGTALTLDQLKTLSHLSKNIKLAFDVDRAGLAATERAVPLAQKLGLNLFVIAIEDAKDPDELIARDPAAWEKAIKEAPEIREYWYQRSREEFAIDDSPSGIQKIQFVKRMAGLLKLYDATSQQVFIDHMASETGIDAKSFAEALTATEDEPTARASSVTADLRIAGGSRKSGQEALEESYLALVLAYPTTRLSLDDLEADSFSSDERRAVFQGLVGAEPDQAAVDIAKALPEVANYVKILALQGEEEYALVAPAERSFEAFTLSRRLAKLASSQRMKDLADQLRQAEKSGDVQLAHELLARYQALIAED